MSVSHPLGSPVGDSTPRRLPINGFPKSESHLLGYQEPSVQWAAIERILSDDATTRGHDSSLHNGDRYAVGGKHKPTTGVWKMPTFSSMARNVWDIITGIFKATWSYATHKTNAVVDDLARESTFAVVTFTSRQAAVAARHCIADGRGHSRWLTVEEIPVPPLADAAPCDFITCRGCCRPVSLSIPKKQQMIRKYTSPPSAGRHLRLLHLPNKCSRRFRRPYQALRAVA